MRVRNEHDKNYKKKGPLTPPPSHNLNPQYGHVYIYYLGRARSKKVSKTWKIGEACTRLSFPFYAFWYEKNQIKL